MRPEPTDTEDRVEAALRADLARGDGVTAGVAPVLRHLLVHDDREFMADDVLAALRGMIAHAASQLSDRDEGDHADLTAALVDVPGLVPLAHALALETHVTRRLQSVQGFDSVLSPLLQALIASDDGETAALAMQVLAAQARFVQQQRRMQWPLGEWPAELLHGALSIDVASVDAAAPERIADLRADYDEGATRLGLLSRLIGVLGPGVVAALDLPHAGVALFASALAHVSGQDRGQALLSLLSRHKARLVLGLKAGGVSSAHVEATLLALHPGATPPEGLSRITPERAATLLHPTGGKG